MIIRWEVEQRQVCGASKTKRLRLVARHSLSALVRYQTPFLNCTLFWGGGVFKTGFLCVECWD